MSSMRDRSTRRGFVALLVMVLALVAASAARVEAQEEQVDPSFSNQILPTLGLPTLELTVAEGGQMSGLPAELPAGKHLVNFSGDGVTGYLLFAQIPEGTAADEAVELARQSGSFDVQNPGWVYGGGTYVDAGATVSVVVTLTPGEWQVAASAQLPGTDFETGEKYTLTPLTVTGDTVTPAASPVASPEAGLPVDVHVDMLDAAFVIEAPTVGTGPKLWEFANTGEAQAHHVVMFRTPREITQADMESLMAGFSAATPTPPEWFTQITWVGYTALVSPGYTVYNEFDLEPGTYALMCFIIDTETQMPHFLMGMWASFTVEG